MVCSRILQFQSRCCLKILYYLQDDSMYIYIYICMHTEGDTLGVRFFTAFCNHWHCTCAMVLSLLCNHWQFLRGFSAMAKQNQNQKKQKNKKPKKQKKNKMTRPNSLPLLPPLGCAILFFLFFLFFVFLVSWFFGFLFSGSLLVFLQWLNKNRIKQQTNKKQETNKNKKMTRPNSLPLLPPWGVQSCFVFFVFLCFWVSWFFGFLFSGSLLVFWRAKDLDLTLCLFSHCRGCKLAFGWFYYLLWAFGGLGTQIRQFCLFM